MTIMQRFYSRIFGPGVEKESHEWMVECRKCGHSESVWDRGGVRYKASGTKYVFGRCQSCGAASMLKVIRSP